MKIHFSWLVRIIALNLVLIVASLTLADSNSQTLPLPNADDQEYVLVEGDIMLPVSVVSGRATYEARLWSQAKVPYVFHFSVDTTNRNRMLAAMAEWETVSGIDFVARTSESNYIEIVNSGSVAGLSTGNWSYVGMIGGRQYLSIYNWTYHYIIMHELAHAAGFWHEQSRPDRNNYVKIQMSNVYSGYEHNFAIRSTASTVGTYDFASIMHYDPYAFSYNGQPTIVAKPGYEAYQSQMGNRSYLTENDKDGMRRLYPKGGDNHNKALLLATQDYLVTSVNTANFDVTNKEPKPSCSSSVGNTVWFKIKPTHDRVLSIYASGYDTILSVFTGKPNEWKQHACADNVLDGSSYEYAMVNAKAGQTYYIMVGGWAGDSGDLVLEVYSYRNLVRNGDFQWGKTNWAVSSKPTSRTDDKVSCGATNVAAYNSKCSFVFKGGNNENSKIVQNIPLSSMSDIPFAAGQAYTLWINAAHSEIGAGFTASVVVTYQNGNKQTLLTMTPSLSTTPAFYTASGTLSQADVKKITLTITHASPLNTNKVWLDNIQLRGPSGTPLRLEPPVPTFTSSAGR